MNEIDDIKRRAGITTESVASWDTPEFHELKRDPARIAKELWMDSNSPTNEMMTFMALLSVESPHKKIETMAAVALAIGKLGGDQAMHDFLEKATNLTGRLQSRNAK